MSGTEPVESLESENQPSTSATQDPEQNEPAEAEGRPHHRSTGTVKWFSVNKGFGFIQPDDGDEEVFVHQTSIRAEGFRSLKENEVVEFDLEIGEDGRGKAINVTGPSGAPPQGAPRPMLRSAPPYAIMPAQPQFGFYDPYTGYPQQFFRGGRFPGRGYLMPGRGGFQYSRGYGGPALERPPPPGTPGISSGFQVVVHNLPWSVTWQELKDVFSHTPGLVRADVIIDAAGRSRGFGTVRYKSREEAVQAADLMNNADIGGRIVTVRIDRFA